MPPRRDENPRRALGYSGRPAPRSQTASRGGRGGRGGQGGGLRDREESRGSRGGRGGRGGERRTRGGRGTGNNSNDRRVASREGGRFGRRGNSNNNAPVSNDQNKPRRGPVVDDATRKLLQSLQERIRVLESQRPTVNPRGGAIRRFGRRVDQIVDGPSAARRPAPKSRRQTEGRGQRRERSPDTRGPRGRGRNQRERFDESRRGGIRDRYDWDEGLESREKRRRRETQAPHSPKKNPDQYPPLRVHVRN